MWNGRPPPYHAGRQQQPFAYPSHPPSFAAAPPSAPPAGHAIAVKIANLNSSVDERRLRGYFAECGRIIHARVDYNRQNVSLRTASIFFESPDCVEKAIGMDGAHFDDNRIFVERSSEQPPFGLVRPPPVGRSEGPTRAPGTTHTPIAREPQRPPHHHQQQQQLYQPSSSRSHPPNATTAPGPSTSAAHGAAAAPPAGSSARTAQAISRDDDDSDSEEDAPLAQRRVAKDKVAASASTSSGRPLGTTKHGATPPRGKAPSQQRAPAGSPGANPARVHGAKLSVVQAADIFDALERLLAHTKKKVQLAGEAQLESLHGWTLEAKMRKNDMKTVDFFVYPTGHRGLKMASREKMKQAMNYDPTSGRRMVRGDPPSSSQAPANAPRHLERSPSAAPPQERMRTSPPRQKRIIQDSDDDDDDGGVSD